MKEVVHEVITIKEVQLKMYKPYTNGAISFPLLVGKDDAKDELLSVLRHWVNHRFALVLRRIDDDERVAPNSNLGVDTGADAASSSHTKSATDGAPSRATHFTKVGGMRRREAPYRKFIIEWAERIAPQTAATCTGVVPVEEFVAKVQHEYCRVKSLRDIRPNTQSALRFDFLESAYAADQAGLDPAKVLGGASHGTKSDVVHESDRVQSSVSESGVDRDQKHVGFGFDL